MASIISQIGTAAPKLVTSLEEGKEIFIPHRQEPEKVKEFTLSVENLTYIVKERRGPWWKGSCFRSARFKKVLDNINLILTGGQLTAILGGSGSGKTSLLDTISYRHDGSVLGQICCRNVPTTREIMNKYSSYVIQADRLLPNLTVRETLTYNARLRLGGCLDSHDIKIKVQKVITSMGLKDVADSRIGASLNRGISGGEKRRVTIGIQLLKGPKILLLDEPTTGLDSYTAKYLIKNLADLAHSGKIVLITIHQPSSDLFKEFDQMVLLSEGRQVYTGPRDNMLSYFTELQYPCPKYANPMDIYVDLGTVDKRNKAFEFESRNRINVLVDSFKQSPTNADTIGRFKNTISPSDKKSLKANLSPEKNETAGPFKTMRTLVSRMYRNLFRDLRVTTTRIVMFPLYIAFILPFLGHLKDDQGSIQDRVGILYQVVIVPAFCAVVLVVDMVPSLRDLFYRESRDGLYGPGMFVISYSLFALPINIFGSTVFVLGIYGVCGLNPGVDKYFILVGVVFAIFTVSEMVALAHLAAIQNPLVAASSCNLELTAALLLSTGFVRNVGSMLEGLQILSYVFIQKYASEVVVVNEFHGLNFTCSLEQECVFKDGDDYVNAFYPDAMDNMIQNCYIICGYLAASLFIPICTFKLKGIPILR